MNAISKQPEDEINEALAYHQGDVRATIAALLAEREFLLREIEYASLAMSYGSRARLEAWSAKVCTIDLEGRACDGCKSSNARCNET
ncbi:hypothetical protein [Phyllobacterium sp. A18/5-2]|uniref:hypothetical protein n=1 Tax=Phyllobacterium sp. A18/5-2 TaxID=2978392 RepID=UPI0029055FA4|nr:hypothetical protein [Phyllobacterium sp. A18/5-2]